MVDKIQKSLNKLSEKEKLIVKNLLLQIKNNSLANLDLKKLKGRSDIFRAKKGKIRIIFRIVAEEVFLLAIEKRNGNTYSRF